MQPRNARMVQEFICPELLNLRIHSNIMLHTPPLPLPFMGLHGRGAADAQGCPFLTHSLLLAQLYTYDRGAVKINE